MALTARLGACLATVLAFGAWSVPAGAATPEDGRRAYEAGSFTDAMGIWAELSHDGNAEAEFGLGLLYDLGKGAPRDPGAAFSWYKAAAEAGLPAAQFNVAAMYDSGRGVARDRQAAALWYAKAAAHGHHRAQFDLGLLYQDGDGVPRNADAAATWFRDALAGGLAAAGSRLKQLPATAPKRPGGDLQGVTLVSPARNAAIRIANDHPSVELVWIAPPEAQPVRYSVRVGKLGSTLQTIFTASVSETAIVVPLPTTDGFYVWNIDTVGQGDSHAAGDWNWFTANPATDPARSVSEPGLSHADR